MKRLGGLILVVLALGAGSAEGKSCVGEPVMLEAFPCSRTFIARAGPQAWTFHGRVDSYASRWITQSGRRFLAGRFHGAASYGRYGDLRVREIYDGEQLRVKYRSVGPPTPVRFSFAVIR